MAFEVGLEKKVVFQDNLKHVGLYLSLTEWEAFKHTFVKMLDFWNLSYKMPYSPFMQRQEIIQVYDWQYVDQLDIVHKKSKQDFFTHEDALLNSKTITSPVNVMSCFSLNIKKKTAALDFKCMVKFLLLYILKKNIIRMKYKKCQSCDENILDQESHLDGCLMTDQMAVVNYFNTVYSDLSRQDLCKFLWEIKSCLKLEISKFEIENTIDCFFAYFSQNDLCSLLKDNTIPLRYMYLFNTIEKKCKI